MEKGHTIGVDIGGTKTNVGLVDGQGNVQSSSSIPTSAEAGGEAIVENVVGEIAATVKRSGLALAQIHSLGFGVPGTVDSRAGVVLFAPNLGWRDFAFAERIRRAFSTPICLAQDTHAAVWAEFLLGAGVGCKNVVCITLGTGIGSGLVVDEHIYLGSLRYVGEVGHSLVELHGRACSCGNNGCLEAYASGTAIEKRGRELIEEHQAMVQDPQRGLTAQDVLRAAERGHPQARQVIDEAAAYLGMGLVNLIHLFGPEKVIVSGGLSNAETLILDPARAFVRERSYAGVGRSVEITGAKLGEYAPMVGAALLHRDDRFRYAG